MSIRGTYELESAYVVNIRGIHNVKKDPMSIRGTHEIR